MQHQTPISSPQVYSPAIKNDLVLKAALGQKTDRTPVWVMRQAGRVLEQYRATRHRAGSFKSLLKNPELACEVTIQPVDLLGVDAAILFSDILVIPEAMGLPYEMEEARGPIFPSTFQTSSDLEKLSIAHIEENLQYVFENIKLIKKELDGRVPLIGFAGAPWTIFCYMVEGRGSKNFSKPRAMLVQNPQLAHTLLNAVTEATIIYLKAQIKHGCDMIQLFDSWAGILDRDLYNTFALPYISKICDTLSGAAPLTVFAKGAFYSLNELKLLKCNTIGLDWQMDPKEARKIFGTEKTLQGNLDPASLYGDFNFIRQETRKMLGNFGPQKHIANLGHGVYPDTDPQKLKCFIDTIKEYQHIQK